MRWSIEKANEWYKEKGWAMGFNYVPSSAVNSTEMWQKASYDAETIKRELAAAADAGFNSCRVFLQFLVWEAERDTFIETFNKFLVSAKEQDISVMPILFDDCAFSNKEPVLGKQQEPVPGVHNSGWTASPGVLVSENPAYAEALESYVKTMVKTFSNNNSILVWDMYNEPGNSTRGTKSLPLLRNAFKWARECNPTQPLTAGVWESKEWDLECIDLSDIISYHDYLKIEESKEHIKNLSKHGRPLFCTEWLHRLNDNNITTHLPLYKENNVSIYNWGLVQGRTQTHLSWKKEENNINGQPKIWQHDLFHNDLRPYNKDEMTLIKKMAARK